MKAMRATIVCSILMLLSMLMMACGGQNNAPESAVDYQALQDEFARLQRDFNNLLNEHNALQDDFVFIQEQMSAHDFESIPSNGEQQNEISRLYYEFQNLLNEHNLLQAELTFLVSQMALVQTGSSPESWEYMVFYRSFRFLYLERDLNIYAQQGWKLVSAVSPGTGSDGVFIMRRER